MLRIEDSDPRGRSNYQDSLNLLTNGNALSNSATKVLHRQGGPDHSHSLTLAFDKVGYRIVHERQRQALNLGNISNLLYSRSRIVETAAWGSMVLRRPSHRSLESLSKTHPTGMYTCQPNFYILIRYSRTNSMSPGKHKMIWKLQAHHQCNLIIDTVGHLPKR